MGEMLSATLDSVSMVYAVRVAAKVNVLLVAKPRPARPTVSVVISQLVVIPIMSAETMVQ